MSLGIRGAHWIAVSIALAGVVVAAAVGFDDAHLTAYQLKVARLLAAVAGGVGVVFSALRYVWERQKELAWQKTAFMVSLFKDFEQDPALRTAQELVDLSRSDPSRLIAALAPIDELHAGAARETAQWWRRGSPGPGAVALGDRLALDRYLDFFDHLYTYIFITETLDAPDASSFSG